MGNRSSAEAIEGHTPGTLEPGKAGLKFQVSMAYISPPQHQNLDIELLCGSAIPAVEYT